MLNYKTGNSKFFESKPVMVIALIDPFFTEARDNGHQGLGLYTSHLLCLAHHGSLTLANAPEGGARVAASFLLFQAPKALQKAGD